MKRTILLKSMLLLCALVAGSSSVWATETPYVTADFTAKTASNATYTNTWTYGNWSLTKCANNNAQWTYIRCGGKGGDKASSTNDDATIIQGTSSINKVIKKVKLIHNGTSNNNFTVNSIVLDVASDAAFNTIVKSITLTPTITKEVAGSVVYTTYGNFPVNSYYRISINWHVKGTKNYGLDVEKIEFYDTVEDFPVTVSNAEYATYVNTSDILDFSGTGIKAYTATDNETSVTLNEITSGKVPANTPVVLYKANADGKAINVPVIASADAISGTNDLRVSDGSNPSNAYVLANKTPNGVGFYPWGGTTLSAGKVYLQAKDSYAPSFLPIGEATGIEDAVKSEEIRDKSYYNLNGQRVAQPTKGLYIVNGKKVIMK